MPVKRQSRRRAFGRKQAAAVIGRRERKPMQNLEEVLEPLDTDPIEKVVEEESAKTEQPEDEKPTGSEEEPKTETGEQEAEPPSVETLQQQLADKDAKLNEAIGQANAFKASAVDERHKRQALQQEHEKKQPLTDVLENQDQFANEILARADERFEARIMASSHRRAERKYGTDYQSKVDAANEYLNDNPSIAAEVFAGDDPVEDAILAHERFLESEQLKDPNYMAAHDAKIAEEAVAKYKAEQEAKAKKTAGITHSLSKETSNHVGETWTGPKPIDDVLQ